jgi:hypothetical protein
MPPLRPAAEVTAPRPASALDAVLLRAMSLLLDVAVVGFAAWTLAYDVAMLSDRTMRTALIAWVVLVAIGVALLAGARRRGPDGWTHTPSIVQRHRGVTAVAIVLAAVAGAGAGLRSHQPAWTLIWTPAVLAALIGVGLGGRAVLRRRDMGDGDNRKMMARGTAMALLVALALATLSLFVNRPDADDVFYVNRAQWVVDHGRFSTRDTIFSDEAYQPVGRPAITSYEALVGTAARVVHLKAGDVAYYVVPPLATFLGVCAMWLLLVAWRVRFPVLALCVAAWFLLLGGAGNGMYGNLFVGRIWQGKIILLSVVVPLLFARLAWWSRGPSWLGAAMLLCLGVAAAGLSTTAPLIVPIIVAAGLVPLALRSPRLALAGAAAAAAYPLVAGVIIRTSRGGGASADVITFGLNDPKFTLAVVFGHGLYAAIGVAAVLAGWLALCSADARLSAALATLVPFTVLAPALLAFANTHLGSGADLWRFFWVVPAAVLVGTAATSWSRHRALAWLSAVAVSLAVLWSGVPVWSASNRLASLTATPRWKIFPADLAQARSITAVTPPGTIVLAPVGTSVALAVLTTRVHPIDPRQNYVAGRTDSFHAAERLLLTGFAESGTVSGAPQDLVAALRTLNVGLACIPRADGSGMALLQSAGYGPAPSAGVLACYIRGNP